MGNPYLLIMSISGIIILSFFFNILAKKTNIPSVLMLIGLGMGMKVLLDSYGLSEDLSLDTLLMVLSNIGLVMIVLEAAIHLKFEKQKKKLVLQSLLVASLILIGSITGLTFFFSYIFPSADVYTAVCYAIPFSLLSSSIILPSVGKLTGKHKEFMHHESTFTTLIGVMLFYFMIGADGGTAGEIGWQLVINSLASILVIFIVVSCLVYLFRELRVQLKLFLLIAVLLLLFSVGKHFHVSLLVILLFGLMLNNTELVFRGRFARVIEKNSVVYILHEYRMLALESAFFIRTFYFVLFGLSITLSSLYNWSIVVNSLAIVAILYLVRFIAVRFFARKYLFPLVFTSPRGLTTLILFFVLANNETFNIAAFDPALLLYPMLITSTITMISLIFHREENLKDVLFYKLPFLRKKDDETLEQRIKTTVETHNFDGF